MIIYATDKANLGKPKEVPDDYRLNTIIETNVAPAPGESQELLGFVDGEWEYIDTEGLSEEVTQALEEIVLTADIDDATALVVKQFYPSWAGGTAYKTGQRLQHGDKLYKVRQDHTSQDNGEPGTTGGASLYEAINETNAGTVDDPIPYDPNMAVEQGKYYIKDGILYYCTRSSGQPLYATAAAMIGHYFEVVG